MSTGSFGLAPDVTRRDVRELPAGVEQGSPEAWVVQLRRKLRAQHTYITPFANYYAGNQRLGFATEKWRNAYGGIFSSFAVNYCALVVDSVAERLQVDGFRIGKEPTADKAANLIWQRNGMDSVSDTGHAEALAHSSAYHLVWPDDEDGTKAQITLEHAAEVFVEPDPNNRRRRKAAIKVYRDTWGFDRVQLWTPTGYYRFTVGSEDEIPRREEIMNERNPFGVVPIVPLVPHPVSMGWPISIVQKIIPLQDAINKILADAIVMSEALALPLRYVLGWVNEADDDDPEAPGSVVKAARSAQDLLKGALLTFPEPDTKVGQLPAADTGGQVGLLRELIQNVATLSRIPFHYFLMNGGQVPSGESMYSAEAGLKWSTGRYQRHLGENHEETMSLAFRIEGDVAKAEERSSEVIWKSAGTRSIAVETDAAVKRVATLGVSTQMAQEDLGYTPQQIARNKALKALDELTLAVTGVQGQLGAPGGSQGAPGASQGVPGGPRPAGTGAGAPAA